MPVCLCVCVCVDLFIKALLVVLMSSSPTSPSLLGPCDKQAELWSTLAAATVATSNPLSSRCKIWVKQKAQETVPFYLFHWPFVPVSLLKEHTASHYPVFLCCCSLLWPASLPNLWWSLFTSRFAQNGQWRRHVLHSVTTVLILSCLLGLAVLTPLPPYMKPQFSGRWTWNIVLGAQ